MELGKIDSQKLVEKVLNNITHHREDVLVPSSIGEDSAVIDMGEQVLVISSDPITGASTGLGHLAVNIACNDIAATGASPIGVQIVALLPAYFSDDDLASLMDEINQTVVKLEAEVLGGHTEILSTLDKPIIMATAIGKTKKDSYIKTGGAKPGDEIIVSKGLGIEGTYILASDYRKFLIEKDVTHDTLNMALSYKEKLSVLKEGKLAAREGAHAMHDITEGGLYGALEEMASASNTGFELRDIDHAVNDPTAEICQALDLDPGGLISSGSMLITAPSETNLVEKIRQKGIKAFKVGKIIEEGKYIIDKKGQKRSFNWQGKDELWRFME